MSKPELVVVGGGYAGVLAALRAARRARGRAQVRLISDRPELVERIRLHELCARGREVSRPLAQLLAGSGVVLEVAKVEGLDPASDRLHTSAGVRGYDALIVATGSRNDASAIPGATAHAHTIERDQASALHVLLKASASGSRVLIVGGGLSGIELAAELAEAQRHLRVTLVTRGELDPRLSQLARSEIERGLTALGVEIMCHTDVFAIELGRADTSRGWLRFDHCIAPSGFRASPLAAQAGLAVDDLGRAWVDPLLCASGRERLFVVGDAARPLASPGSEVFMGCKTAMPQGAQAAENAVATLLGSPLQALDWRETGYCVSLGRRRGVIQMANRFGDLEERILRGRLGAFVKEAISRYTIASLHAERRGWFSYRWFRMGSRRAHATFGTTEARRA